MWRTYFQPTSLEEALDLLRQYAGEARIVAGGTDVVVELSRGVRPTTTLIDLTAVSGLKYIREREEDICLGALATHNDVIASPACVRRALPLAQACWEVGAPQIRTRATVAGNLVTASPANDTITALMALDAELVLARQGGERVVALADFYPGFRRTVLQPDELIREIRVPALAAHQRGLFLKLGLRRAQAISVIDVAMVLTFSDGVVSEARIALGSLAPTVVRASTAEMYLRGKRLDDAVCARAGYLACEDAAPIDDVRGSATYRSATLSALVAQGLQRIAAGREAEGWMERPVLLDTAGGMTPGCDGVAADHARNGRFDGTIGVTVNGQFYRLAGAQHKTLLNLLREDVGLTGTKEGCAEGECGACTAWLNGQAVMSCLVPAPQAHNATVTTIEGLAAAGGAVDGDGARLHPLQRAFIDCAAVQCGYCIPGMLMAGAKLLQEYPHPDLDQVRIALSGNICRCTGYRKILDALFRATESMAGGQR